MDVLHADNHLLVVAKPAGVPLVPDASGDPSLLDEARAWVARTYAKPGAVYLGVVHRLDRPVSGVVVLARTSKAARRLTEAFRSRAVEKRYLGVSDRLPAGAEGAGDGGVLVQWLSKDRARNVVRVLRGPAPGAKEAVTRWRVLAVEGAGPARRVLLELVPETGRSHQLRVAAATLGAPLLGDVKYGAASPLPDRSVALHARTLAFEHPTTRERLAFVREPPARAPWRFHAPLLERDE